ncbi:hypothetical protein [Aestuariicoccus sp. MJ-SS9]|uniref:hypothetical protein n=1 Tax=Aestuariicoccus sp. MJ-SS9 TaxID=3079855 RepID=UPI00290B56B8|nr:hypothetical protein [Aestuariicoccus sp. MJ-SS9]MDU8914005.1 hypothetical protein [Aestuariicoccus sp. MJ-SS9]
MTDNRIMLVSYPRSGQHYTQRMIERAIGKDDYCPLYACSVPDCPGRGKPVPEKTPCPGGRRIQKHHDFDLGLRVEDEITYAVLIRYPLNSLMSYYEQEVNRHKRVPRWADDGKVSRVEDNEENWLHFLENRAAFWKEFATKWRALAERHDNVRIFRYEEMVWEDATFLDFFRFSFTEDLSEKAHELIAAQRKSMTQQGRTVNGRRAPFAYDEKRADARMRQIIAPDLLQAFGYE